ncbi:MAG: PqqD family protein [Butyricicoccus sp.]|nr:PqqD family protein [Butyricicoccus sp.]
MKVSNDFILREIAGEYILVPVGAAAAKFNGLITLNELGKFIFEALADDCTLEQLVDKITAEYDVDAATAAADAEEFLGELRGIGALLDA